jgi:hypothetical protein
MSPTRLEGMETRRSFCCVHPLVMSPTRLEGMETQHNTPISLKVSWSPTRLEGMETIGLEQSAPKVRAVSDPP